MLAIIIPYYKLTFFNETLASLSNQTDKRFKVYICDDASPENPSDLLGKFHGKFDFIYHRFETNLGGTSLTQQWERCIALSANEEWLMILGDDDVLGTNVVEAFYQNLEEIKTVSNVVRFATTKIDKKGERTSAIYHHPRIEKTIDFLFRNTRSSLSEYLFTRKKVNEIGFKNFCLAWYSDVLAVLEFSEFKEIYTINEAVVSVRITDLSISGNKNNLKLKAKAKFDFYYYLLLSQYKQFSEHQNKELFYMLNKCYLNDKKNVALFFKISRLHFHYFLVKEYFHFIQLIIFKSLKNKANANRR